MRVNLKYYNKHLRKMFVAFNVLLIAAMIVAFLVFVVLSGTENDSRANSIGIVFLSLFGVFAILNCFVIFANVSVRKRISETVKAEIKAQRYDAAIEYLKGISQRKNLFSINQMVLFQLGYIELLKDNVEDALYYFEQFDTRKITRLNAYCFAMTVPLLNAIYIHVNDGVKQNKIKAVYEKNKAILIKLTKANDEIILLFGMIERLNDGKIHEFDIARFKSSRYYNIPLLRRFVLGENCAKN